MSLRGGQSPTKQSHKELLQLENEITSCKKCPRLVKYISEINETYPTYWCKPVPGFGDYNAEILILGLAPGRFGSNRTGRMFTGDSSGNFMYPILHEAGLCNQPESTDINDGLKLKNCFITAVGRCAPPQNKPTPKELENCFPYFVEELKLLKNLKTIVCLGKIAFDGYLKWAIEQRRNKVTSFNDVLRKQNFKFSHGAIYENNLPHTLIASYHPSRQNTQTGRLTKVMFKRIFESAIHYCG